MTSSWFSQWRKKSAIDDSGMVAPDETLPAGQTIVMIAPVAVILVAENLGNLKAVAAMTGRNLDPYIGRR